MDRRLLAAALIAVGTTGFGLACGWVYEDQRNLALWKLQIEYDQMLKRPGSSGIGRPPEPQDRPELVRRAMLVGPAGAGLALAGVALGVFELPWFRRRPAV